MKKESRNWQKVGESLPKEWGITEFEMDGKHIVLTSKGIWMELKSPEQWSK